MTAQFSCSSIKTFTEFARSRVLLWYQVDLWKWHPRSAIIKHITRSKFFSSYGHIIQSSPKNDCFRSFVTPVYDNIERWSIYQIVQFLIWSETPAHSRLEACSRLIAVDWARLKSATSQWSVRNCTTRPTAFKARNPGLPDGENHTILPSFVSTWYKHVTASQAGAAHSYYALYTAMLCYHTLDIITGHVRRKIWHQADHFLLAAPDTYTWYDKTCKYWIWIQKMMLSQLCLPHQIEKENYQKCLNKNKCHTPPYREGGQPLGVFPLTRMGDCLANMQNFASIDSAVHNILCMLQWYSEIGYFRKFLVLLSNYWHLLTVIAIGSERKVKVGRIARPEGLRSG